MNCLKKCFGTLGSKISHLFGESIHYISCKGNTCYSGKLVNSSSVISEMDGCDGHFILFMCSDTSMHSALLCHTLFLSTDIQHTLKWFKLTYWSTALAFKKWFFMLGELLRYEEGRVLITPPHRCMLGKVGFIRLCGTSGQCDVLSYLCVVDGAAEGTSTAPYFPGCHPEPVGSHPLHHSLAGQLLVHWDPESTQAFVWEEQSLPVRGCPHAIRCRCEQCFIWGHSALQLGDWRWPLCLQILPYRDVAFLWREHGRAR